MLRVVEAAYGLDGAEQGWLATLAESAARALGGRMGAVGYRFRITPDGTMELAAGVPVATAEVPEGFARVVRRAAETVATHHAETFRDRSLCLATGSQVAKRGAIPSYDPDRWDAYAESVRLGVLDHLGVTALEPNGEGLHICVPLAQTMTVGPRRSARWRRVSAHIAAGMRLRASAAEAEAILDPGGRKLLHAEGPARERSARDALRDAAVAIDAARGRAGREDPEGALRAWQVLVQGRWSIVDRFERDGRRYLVARRNAPDVGPAHGLSEREAQVAAFAALGHTNKHIAYALGLQPSTVSCHLRSAMRRLGARSHAELADILRASRLASGEA